ncbi:MAG: hypothetical protein COA74_01390 [Gammaproteobacteria bacterium]|nr:MAG: hypothetical protein COA74_01390 [Gammaproteobacteria bacterium]
MKLSQLILPVILLTISTFSVRAQNVTEPSLVAIGAKLYGDNCGRCHNPRPAEEYSKKEWSVVIPHMRAKAHMTGKEALAVEAFLASTLTADLLSTPSNTKVDAPKRTGAELVAQFGCQGCLQIKGIGGNLRASLDGIVETKGMGFVLKKLKNPKFNNASSAMPRYPMSHAEMKRIIDYINKN